jgi:PAS domain-containing protein
MNRLDNLTLRTTTALGRLASLQRRADKSATPTIVRDALEELSSALEELRTANEALVDQATEIAASRERDQGWRRDLQMLFANLPLPCVFTDNAGHILDANPEASRLLNVGRQHLVGKALLLFLMERDRLMQALELPPESGQVQQVTVVRPRERRPREVLLKGTRFPDGERWCWFFDRPAAVPEPE